MDVNGLLTKLKGLGKPDAWVEDAVLVLDSKSDLVKLAVFTATNESAVALVNKVLAGAAAGPGARSAAEAGAGASTSSAAADQHAAHPTSRLPDTTSRYLADCLQPFGGHTLLEQGAAATLRQRLVEPLKPGLPLLPHQFEVAVAIDGDLSELLVSTTNVPRAATAYALGRHVANIVLDTMPITSGSESYTAINVFSVVERTLRFIMRYRSSGPRIVINRNTADRSGATSKKMRPDFLLWLNGALLFKGEEKAQLSDFGSAIAELKAKMSWAWAPKLMPGVQLPCMLGYAAAENYIQFFCIEQGRSGEAELMPISDLLDFNSAIGRFKGMLAAFNIWRLLAGYAEVAPSVPIALGQTLKSTDGLCTVTLLPGFIRKCIRQFQQVHEERVASFALLKELYGKMSRPEHKGAIIQACGIGGADAGPRLQDNEYVVHLAPVGMPCTGPPATEAELVSAVRGVLRGLVALHSEGFVHRDLRWQNVILLPAEERWLLIDLENAGREGGEYRDGGAYTAASDLEKVVGLMADLSYSLSISGCSLRQQLLGGGLSAADALKHHWLAEA